MLSPKDCSLKLLGVYKDSIILSCYDDTDKLIYSIEPKNGLKVLDAFFSVNKKTGKIEEYAYLNDLSHFKNLLKNNELSKSEYL